jgi:ABC-type bacteriocin/lantibiotic exporter with double-glycine peptidase domain
MYITEQINRAECGICVLNTLFYHYYGRNIKQELLKLAPISEQGINIFDLENLAIKHGILLESYHASITELMTIKNNGLLITLVKEKDGLHYTLIKIHKKYIEIFDSIKGHYQINLDNFNQIYTGTIIIPHKHKIQFDENNKFNFHPFFKFRYVLTNLFLQLAVIISSIVGANYFRMIMIHGTSQKSIKNLILVSFVFLLFFVINELAVFVQRLLIRKTVHINCMLLTKQFIDSLTKKNNQFHLKNDITKLNRVEEAIMYICNFHG